MTGAVAPLHYDFGDAPDTYRTLLKNDEARHVIANQLCLGKTVDSETDGQPNPLATGDDLPRSDDEDGVTFLSSLIPGRNTTIRVMASAAGKLDAWIDFNGDGD